MVSQILGLAETGVTGVTCQILGAIAGNNGGFDIPSLAGLCDVHGQFCNRYRLLADGI